MDPIEAEVTNAGNNSSETIKEERIESVKYKDIGLTYEFIDHNSQKWYQQVVGEHMLGVRTKQFDRYCDEMIPKIEKRRVKTVHYSYNFIKESDIFMIAEKKGKVVQIPLRDIQTTDANKKVFSKTDLDTIGENIVQEKAAAIFQQYNERIKTLETTNSNLSTELVSLSKDKSGLLEEKFAILNKKRIWKTTTIVITVILVVGGIAGGTFLFNVNNYNDQLIATSQTKTRIISEKDKEISGLNIKLKTQEIEYLKKQIPTTQSTSVLSNTEISQ